MSGEPRPYQPATPEEIARIDAALEATKGNRTHAAIALKVEPQRVINLVQTNPYLHLKWGSKPDSPIAPTPAADIHRPKPLVSEPFTSSEKEMVVAIKREDLMLQRGWKRLGFDAEQRKFLAGLQATYAGNLKSTMDLAYGGAAHANTRLLLLLESLIEKIADIKAHPDKYERSYMTEHGVRTTKGADEYLKEFTDLAVKVSSELRKMGDSVTKANELRLKMERLRMAQRDPVRREAGWETAKPAEKDP